MSSRNASGFRPGAASLNFGARATQNLNRGQVQGLRPNPTPTQGATPIQRAANVVRGAVVGAATSALPPQVRVIGAVFNQRVADGTCTGNPGRC